MGAGWKQGAPFEALEGASGLSGGEWAQPLLADSYAMPL